MFKERCTEINRNDRIEWIKKIFYVLINIDTENLNFHIHLIKAKEYEYYYWKNSINLQEYKDFLVIKLSMLKIKSLIKRLQALEQYYRISLNSAT